MPEVTRPKGEPRREAESAARALLRSAAKVALATLDRTTGHPYASLAAVATAADATPLLLISNLAWHTQNLAADSRASLLLDASGSDGDPVAGGRLSLIGRLVPTLDPAADRARYLARHPGAAIYADFTDFVFHRFAIERAHWVGGFGRIVDIAPQQLMTEIAGAEPLLAAESATLRDLNQHYTDLLVRAAAPVLRGPKAPTAVALDPDGIDLLCGGETVRLAFEVPAGTPAEAIAALRRLASASRGPSA